MMDFTSVMVEKFLLFEFVCDLPFVPGIGDGFCMAVVKQSISLSVLAYMFTTKKLI
jgi:hypothetical protein